MQKATTVQQGQILGLITYITTIIRTEKSMYIKSIAVIQTVDGLNQSYQKLLRYAVRQAIKS